MSKWTCLSPAHYTCSYAAWSNCLSNQAAVHSGVLSKMPLRVILPKHPPTGNVRMCRAKRISRLVCSGDFMSAWRQLRRVVVSTIDDPRRFQTLQRCWRVPRSETSTLPIRRNRQISCVDPHRPVLAPCLEMRPEFEALNHRFKTCAENFGVERVLKVQRDAAQIFATSSSAA